VVSRQAIEVRAIFTEIRIVVRKIVINQNSLVNPAFLSSIIIYRESMMYARVRAHPPPVCTYMYTLMYAHAVIVRKRKG
jgi:hypothetical protein